MKSIKKDIIIPPLKGKKTIARSDIFSYVDNDFENYGTDKIGLATKEKKVEVFEMTKDGTFQDIFTAISTNLESLCLSQEQILYFIENHKSELRDDGYYTFFLFNVATEFFVACVDVLDGGLRARVCRFSFGHVWGAGRRRRVVVPQLDTQTPSPSDSLKLRLSDTSALEQRIADLESDMAKIKKFLII